MFSIMILLDCNKQLHPFEINLQYSIILVQQTENRWNGEDLKIYDYGQGGMLMLEYQNNLMFVLPSGCPFQLCCQSQTNMCSSVALCVMPYDLDPLLQLWFLSTCLRLMRRQSLCLCLVHDPTALLLLLFLLLLRRRYICMYDSSSCCHQNPTIWYHPQKDDSPSCCHLPAAIKIPLSSVSQSRMGSESGSSHLFTFVLGESLLLKPQYR